jgi:hypothetical protein
MATTSLQHHITFQMAVHNLTRPHFALKKTQFKKKSKVWKKYDKKTPMMSIGLTEHI